MKTVVLISSPLSLEARYGKFSIVGNTQPTFALVCLAAVAQEEGADVRIIDAAAEGLTVNVVYEEVLRMRPDMVGISSTTVGIVSSGDLAEKIKAGLPKTVTVIGGCHVTAVPEETLNSFPGFDLAVIGEGEETFRELIRSLEAEKTVPHDLTGTAVRRNGSIQVNPRRPFIQDPDALPLPAWRLLRGFPENFHPTPTRTRRFPCASIVLTRGCPNQCLFCDRSVFGNKIRSLSVEKTIQLVKDLRYTYGVREILIEDDTFVIAPKRIEEFCNRIIEEKIDISWSCLGRADRVNPGVLRLMKKAGCWHMSFGIESGDQAVLDAMRKNEKIIDIQNAVTWCYEIGIRTAGFFILGFPGETRESMAKTADLALKLMLDDISIMRLTPFPGTAIFKDVSSYGTFESDWEKMNALNPVFVPHGLQQGDLDAARDKILKAFYLRPRIVMQKMQDIFRNPRLLIPLLKGLIAFSMIFRKK